jgi:hypothetical protein
MDMNLTFITHIRFDATNINHTRLSVGLSGNGAPASSNTSFGTALCMFKFNSEDGDTQLVPISSASGNPVSTLTPFGPTITAGLEVDLKIVISGGGTTAEFFINGVSGGSLTSSGNFPAVSAQMSGTFQILGIGAGVTRLADTSYQYAECPIA